jgi:acetyltransferase-like isoleucine patch superfamily enzyme
MKNFIQKIKSNPRLKALALALLMPKGQPRPRLWVRLFYNPMVHKKGEKATIRSRTRIDVLPFNGFAMGKNSTIEDFCVVNNGMGDVIIGDRSRVGISSVVIGPVKIGNDVILAQHVVMSGLNHGYEDVTIPIKDQKCTVKPIVIEDEAWIGANAVITSGVTVGKHSIVAAGSVVTKNVAPYTIVGGNPAKVLKVYNAETKEWEKPADQKSKQEKITDYAFTKSVY